MNNERKISDMNRVGRIVSAVLLGAALLTSCKAKTEPVLTFGDTVISENYFTYYLATYKNSFFASGASEADINNYYNQLMPNGQTGEEYLFDQTVHNVSLSLICAELYDKTGQTLSAEVTQTIYSYVDSLINDYAGGDKNALNGELAQFGINVNMLREIYILEEKGTALLEYLYGDNGTIGVTDEEMDAYYKENYVHARHIYVNNVDYFETTEDGYYKYDENGNRISTPYSGEKLEEKNAVIASIDAALAEGMDFEEVYNLYSEDKNYENGYYFYKGMDFIEEVVDAAFTLEVGEYVKITSARGVHYIKRLEYDEKPWEKDANKDFFGSFLDNVRFETFRTYVEQYVDQVVINKEKLKEFSLRESPTNVRF